MSTGSNNERTAHAPAPSMTSDPDALRALMRHWPAGVTVVTAFDSSVNEPRGMTVSTFTSLSLEPLLVSVFLHKEAETAKTILSTEAFAVSILTQDQAEWSNRFAGFDPRFKDQTKRFENINTHQAVTDVPILSDALGWVDCKLWNVYDGSTHHIVIGEVVAISPEDTLLADPLIYYNRGYQRLSPLDE